MRGIDLTNAGNWGMVFFKFYNQMLIDRTLRPEHYSIAYGGETAKCSSTTPSSGHYLMHDSVIIINRHIEISDITITAYWVASYIMMLLNMFMIH